MCPEFRQCWHDPQEALWKKKLPFFKLEACLVKKDKSLVWVKVTTVLFCENDITYGFTVLDDFTSTKTPEDSEKNLRLSLENAKKIKVQLRHNEQHLSQILETMAEGVCIIDHIGKLTYTNPMAQKIFGHDQNEMLRTA